MVEPRYQPSLDADVPKANLLKVAKDTKKCSVAPLDDGYVRVIAGQYNDTKGPAMTYSPVNLWDIILSNKNQGYEFEIEAGHTLLGE